MSPNPARWLWMHVEAGARRHVLRARGRRRARRRRACRGGGGATSPPGRRRSGPVAPEVVEATFYGFAPALVRKCIPSAWDAVRRPPTPSRARDAAVARRLRPPRRRPSTSGRVELAERAAAACRPEGRSLYAAHAAWVDAHPPAEPLAAPVVGDGAARGSTAAMATTPPWPPPASTAARPTSSRSSTTPCRSSASRPCGAGATTSGRTPRRGLPARPAGFRAAIEARTDALARGPDRGPRPRRPRRALRRPRVRSWSPSSNPGRSATPTPSGSPRSPDLGAAHRPRAGRSPATASAGDYRASLVTSDPYVLADEAAAAITEATGVPAHDVAVVLGSGWRPAADRLRETVAEVPLDDLAGFAPSTVAGHSATVRSIRCGDRRLLVFLGRTHAYEGHEPVAVAHGVRAAVRPGARSSCSPTPPAGSARRHAPWAMPCSSATTSTSPAGRPSAAPTPDPDRGWGPRFTDLTDAYSPRLRDLARELDPALTEGVYAAVPGPHYETPAEIRAYRVLGADLVGHVDGARGDRGPPRRRRGAGPLARHQPGRRPVGRPPRPRRRPRRRPGRRRADGRPARPPRRPSCDRHPTACSERAKAWRDDDPDPFDPRRARRPDRSPGPRGAGRPVRPPARVRHGRARGARWAPDRTA